jgi:hypothetical protein
MTNDPADTAAAPLVKSGTSKVALAIGAATILISVLRVALAAVGGKWTSSMSVIPIPWVAAGIALIVRSLRGALPWPRGIAAWTGGFLMGMIFMILGVAILGGRGDSTFWILNTMAIALFFVLGILLLRAGFKR